jgi:hypothetical protein
MSSTESAYSAGKAAGANGATAPAHVQPSPYQIQQAANAGFAQGRQPQPQPRSDGKK